RGAGRDALGGRAPARHDRACDRPRRADPDPRRAHVGARCRDRGGDHGGPPRAHARADDVRDRAPALDDPRGRPDRRPARRRRRGARDVRRPGRPRRRVHAALRGAVRRARPARRGWGSAVTPVAAADTRVGARSDGRVVARADARIVVLGIAAQYPMAGVTWQAIHYLLGLAALGCDVWYVEDSGAPPYDPTSGGIGVDARANVAYLAATMRRIGFDERWAYWDVAHDVWHGLERGRVDALYRSAAAIVNLCGATRIRDEHHQGARVCYVETDPVYEQIRVARGEADSIAFLAAHDVLFTYGELLGTPGSPIPLERFAWRRTRPPVVLDEWRPGGGGEAFRTIATWENKGKSIVFRGATYEWSKHVNFLRTLALPHQTGAHFELAMDPLDDAVRARFAAHGWTLVDPRPLSADLDAYRAWIETARAEFTVAKDIYVRPR